MTLGRFIHFGRSNGFGKFSWTGSALHSFYLPSSRVVASTASRFLKPTSKPFSATRSASSSSANSKKCFSRSEIASSASTAIHTFSGSLSNLPRPSPQVRSRTSRPSDSIAAATGSSRRWFSSSKKNQHREKNQPLSGEPEPGQQDQQRRQRWKPNSKTSERVTTILTILEGVADFLKRNAKWVVMALVGVFGLGVGTEAAFRLHQDFSGHRELQEAIDELLKAESDGPTVNEEEISRVADLFDATPDVQEKDTVHSEPVAAVPGKTHKSQNDWKMGKLTRDFVYLLRSVRIAYVVLATVADYKLSFWNLDEEKDAEEWVQLREIVDRRCARRIQQLCLQYGGVFVKAAQMLSTMSHALPQPYIEELVVLQDDVPGSPFESVRESFLAEFGRLPEQMFREFSPTPVASASIAQVHRAVRHDGIPVAVKVQYLHIAQQNQHTLQVLEPLLRLVGKMYPRWDMSWIVGEFRRTMDQELDFRREADNSRRISGLFAGRDDVYVPWVDPHNSGGRILTMEWVTGCKVDQADRIRNLGFDPLDVATLLAKSFGEMVFRFGFVHADPHPANIWVTKNKSGKPQLILLDHGLYRELDPAFRTNYCKLWRSFYKRDLEALHTASTNLGIAKYSRLLPVMFTYRAVDSQTRLGQLDQMEIAELLKETLGTDSFNQSAFLSSLPTDMLFALKINHLVRHANRSLGGTSRGRLKITFQCAVEGLHSSPENQRPDPDRGWTVAPLGGPTMTLQQKLSCWWDLTNLELGFLLFEHWDSVQTAAWTAGALLSAVGIAAALFGTQRGQETLARVQDRVFSGEAELGEVMDSDAGE